MSKQIIKVIYHDDTFDEFRQYEPYTSLKEKTIDYRRGYRSDLIRFEDKIIENLNQNNLEEYSTNEFNLINENDVEEKTVEDFSSKELISELKDRGIIPFISQNIITDDLFQRFLKIVEKENHIQLDNIFKELEQKLNII